MNSQDRLRILCWNCGATYDLSFTVPDGMQFEGNVQLCPFCLNVNIHPSGFGRELKATQPPESQARNLQFAKLGPHTHEPIITKTAELRDPAFAFFSNVIRLGGTLTMPHMLIDNSGRGVDIDQLSATNREVWMGLDAILVGQFTGMWTAFEVLAGDLWEAALNAHPRKLSDLKAGKRKAKRPKVDVGVVSTGGQTQDDKQVPLNMLQKFDYDLSQKMGTLLRKKYNFTKLEGIQDAYWEAFDDANIRQAVDCDTLNVLSAIRNIFVHKAGKADEEFSNRVSQNPALATIEIGQRVPVDGVLVQQIIPPAIQTTINLIHAVDAWISGSPDYGRKNHGTDSSGWIAGAGNPLQGV